MNTEDEQRQVITECPENDLESGRTSSETNDDLDGISADEVDSFAENVADTAPDMNTEDKQRQGITECLENELESGRTSSETNDDLDGISADEVDSFAQNVVDTHLEIPDTHEQSRVEEINSNENSNTAEGSNATEDSDMQSPGAFHVPGRGRSDVTPQSSDEIINAIAETVTGETIDNAYVVTDDYTISAKRKEQKSYDIFVYISVTICVIVILCVTLVVSQTNANTAVNDTMNITITKNHTTLTIDAFKQIIIESNISSEEDLMNISSPQSKALDWMRNEEISISLLQDVKTESLIQRYISVVFYYSLNGQNWTKQFMFLTEGLSECMWGDDSSRIVYNDGITCHKNGTISRIFLGYENLSGTIPSEVGYLNSMQNLELPGNEISGSIPSSIGKIDSLMHLNLNSNRFAGTIPISLANMNNLNSITVGNSNLTGYKEFCPVLGGKDVRLVTDCDVSQLLDKEECDEYTELICCSTIERKCCHSNATITPNCFDGLVVGWVFPKL